MVGSGARRLAIAGAGVVGVAAVVTGVVLGVGQDDDTRDVPGEQRSEVGALEDGADVGSGRSSDAVQERANRLYERFAGTPAQRNAAGILQAWDLNGAMAECMAREGFPDWDWSAQRNTASRTDALATSTFFAEPAGRSYSNATMDRAAEAMADERGMQEEPAGSEADAVTTCLDGTAAASAGQHAPAPARRLVREWWRMTAELDQQYGDQRAFATCFARAELSFDADGDSLAEAQIALSYVVPSATEIPAGPDDVRVGGEQWQAFLRAERELDDASWGCRSDVYQAHIEDVDEAIGAFAADHRRQIAAAQRGWAEVTEEAAELG